MSARAASLIAEAYCSKGARRHHIQTLGNVRVRVNCSTVLLTLLCLAALVDAPGVHAALCLGQHSNHIGDLVSQ